MSKRSTLTLTLSLKGEGINGWALSIGVVPQPCRPAFKRLLLRLLQQWGYFLFLMEFIETLPIPALAGIQKAARRTAFLKKLKVYLIKSFMVVVLWNLLLFRRVSIKPAWTKAKPSDKYIPIIPAVIKPMRPIIPRPFFRTDPLLYWLIFPPSIKLECFSGSWLQR